MSAYSLRFVMCLALSLCVSQLLPRSVIAGGYSESLKTSLGEVLSDLSRNGVLGSVMAIDVPQHKTLFLTAGVADESGRPMDATLLFQIGSQTKMFTAAAILLLQREGKLSLTDPVSQYVTGLTGSTGVTIEQLLTHTSGIGDSVSVFDPPAVRPEYDVSFEDHLLLSRVAGVRFEAGTDWRYNNLAYIVLGKIIEHASGQGVDHYIRTNLLEPLGMHSTWLGGLESYPEKRMARGYFRLEDSDELIDTTMPNLSWASTAGDMVSNASDMLIWANAMLNNNNPVGLSLDDFQTAMVKTGSSGNMTHYGYGLMGRNLNGWILWGHGGNIHGYVSLILMDPQSGISVVLMTNLKDFPENLLPVLESVVSMAFRMSKLLIDFEKAQDQLSGAEENE